MQFDVQSVIRRIEIRLAEIGMTKQEFYEKSGISSGSFSQWNTGKHAPSIKKVQRAASVIGVTTEYLLYGVDPMPDFAVKSPIVARINSLLAASSLNQQSEIPIYTCLSSRHHLTCKFRPNKNYYN